MEHKFTMGISKITVPSATRKTCCTLFSLATISRLGAAEHVLKASSRLASSCIFDGKKCKVMKL